MNTSIEEKAAPAVLTHEMSDPEMFVSLLQGFRESQNPGVRGGVDLYPAAMENWLQRFGISF